MLACVDRGSRTLRALEEAGRFGVNVLEAGNAELAARLRPQAPGRGEVAGRRLGGARAASRVLDAAIVWIGCELRDVISGGDHVIVTGEVLDVAERDGRPLIFHEGEYRRPLTAPLRRGPGRRSRPAARRAARRCRRRRGRSRRRRRRRRRSGRSARARPAREGVAGAAAALDPRVDRNAVAQRALLDRVEDRQRGRRLPRLRRLERQAQRDPGERGRDQRRVLGPAEPQRGVERRLGQVRADEREEDPSRRRLERPAAADPLADEQRRPRRSAAARTTMSSGLTRRLLLAVRGRPAPGPVGDHPDVDAGQRLDQAHRQRLAPAAEQAAARRAGRRARRWCRARRRRA